MIARIKLPDAALRDAFLRMLDDYTAHDPENGEYYAPARRDFAAYVQSLLNEEQGLNLPPQVVPCSHRWLLNEVDDCVAGIDAVNTCVGVVRVRHNIDTEFLSNEAGHIGYDVAPSFRRRGYGVACLQAGLSVARQLEIDRVLLYADTDNVASWKVIERCGGVLEAECYSAHYQVLVRRYWVQV